MKNFDSDLAEFHFNSTQRPSRRAPTNHIQDSSYSYHDIPHHPKPELFAIHELCHKDVWYTANLTVNLPQILPSIYHKSYRQLFWIYLV